MNRPTPILPSSRRDERGMDYVSSMMRAVEGCIRGIALRTGMEENVNRRIPKNFVFLCRSWAIWEALEVNNQVQG